MSPLSRSRAFWGRSEDIHSPPAPTPWVSLPGQYTGQCEHANGASWLQLTDVGPPEDPREKISEVLGPLWGTHLEDVNVPLGNLVNLTGLQSATYEQETAPPAVSEVTPSSGSEAGGTEVTIKGSGFLAGATVTIGSEATVDEVVSSEEIKATTKAHAPGAEEVVVETTNGKSVLGPSFDLPSSPAAASSFTATQTPSWRPGPSSSSPDPPPKPSSWALSTGAHAARPPPLERVTPPPGASPPLVLAGGGG